jgi:hypothetical protein
MTFEIKAGVAALALILTPLALHAAPKGEHGNGGSHGHSAQTEHGNSAFGHSHQTGGDTEEDGDDSGEDGDDVAEDDTGHHPCAPGLASRDTPCVPPGQARQGVTTEEWIGGPTDGYAAGDDISDESYGLIANADQLGLDEGALEDGQAYALIGDTIIVVDEDGRIVSVVRRAAIPGHSNG